MRAFVFIRPINDAGERVTPSNLLEYRRSHDFKGPCCLCASVHSDEAAYTESAIFLAVRGPSAGKYVSACATGHCRYWGKTLTRSYAYVNMASRTCTVCLEQFYDQIGLLVKRYGPRGRFLFIASSFIPLQLTTYSIMDGDAAETTIPVLAPPIPHSQSDAAQRLQVVEGRMGPVLDQVVQSPHRSGDSAASAVHRTRRQRSITNQYTCKLSSLLFHFIAMYSHRVWRSNLRDKRTTV